MYFFRVAFSQKMIASTSTLSVRILARGHSYDTNAVQQLKRSVFPSIKIITRTLATPASTPRVSRPRLEQLRLDAAALDDFLAGPIEREGGEMEMIGLGKLKSLVCFCGAVERRREC